MIRDPAASPAGPGDDVEDAHQREGALLARTMRGAGWVVGWRFSTRILGLASTLVLARVLVPADFGLVALGTGFVQAVDALSAFGVEEALVREHHPDRDLYDTAFTMNALRGLTTAALVLALAGPTAQFFSEPRLAGVLLVLGGALALSAFENIGIVDYRRDFAFHMEFRLLLLPRVAGIVAAIGSALAGAGYWALVLGILVTRVLRFALSYAFSAYRPRLGLRRWRYLLGFSVWTWMIWLAGLINDRLPSFFIGRLLDARHVGLFALGAETAALPTTELVEPLCRACYSAFAVGRHSGHDAARLYTRVVSTVLLLTLPAGIGIALLAAPIVRLTVGPQWAEVVPVIQVMALAGVASTFTTVGMTLFDAHALLRTILKISLAVMLIRVLLLALALHGGGILAAAAACGLAVICENAMYVQVVAREFGVRFADTLKLVWRCVVATLVMAAALAALGPGWQHAASGAALAAGVLGSVAFGAVVYGLALAALWYATGRPAGAERDVLSVLRRLAGLGGRR